MEIRRKSGHFTMERKKKNEFHCLVAARSGFQMLDIYGETYGVPRAVIHAFVNEVNERNEPGTLLPYPISAIPRKYIFEHEDVPALTEMIVQFLAGYVQTAPATCLLLDFRNWVSPWVVTAMEEAVKCPEAQSLEWMMLVMANHGIEWSDENAEASQRKQ